MFASPGLDTYHCGVYGATTSDGNVFRRRKDEYMHADPSQKIVSALFLTTTLDSITGVLGTHELTFSITPTHFQIGTRSYDWDTIDVIRFVGPTLYVRASGRVQGYGPIAESILTDARDWLEGVVHTYLHRSSSQTVPDALQRLRDADHTPGEE